MGSTVTVRYFATFKEQIGLESEKLTLDEHTDLRTFLNRLVDRHPDIEQPLETAAIAVNQETVKPSTSTVKPGDEVALLPPFGGGQNLIKPGPLSP